MENVNTAVSIDMYYGGKNTDPVPVTEETPSVRNIHLSNITAINVEKAAEILGLPESLLENVSITNSNFTSEKGFEVIFVKDFTLKDVTVNCKTGSPLNITMGDEIEIDNFKTKDALQDEALIKLNRNGEVYIHDCNVKEGTKIFLQSSESSNLKTENNWLKDASIIQQ
jgi:hypothetical protein